MVRSAPPSPPAGSRGLEAGLPAAAGSSTAATASGSSAEVSVRKRTRADCAVGAAAAGLLTLLLRPGGVMEPDSWRGMGRPLGLPPAACMPRSASSERADCKQGRRG